MKDAACRDADPELFFPERGKVSTHNEALRYCIECPVMQECTDFRKLTNSRYGIWGGKHSKRKPDPTGEP